MESIKIGDVEMDAVVREIPTHTAEITDKPIEKGADISDHMKIIPAEVQVRGTMTQEAASKLQTLKSYQQEKKLVKYVGRNIYWNMAVRSIETDHAVDAYGGYHYQILLRQVFIARPETFQNKVKDPQTHKQDSKTSSRVKEKTNIGRQQPEPKRAYTENKRGALPRGYYPQKYDYQRIITAPGNWKPNAWRAKYGDY